MTNGGHWIASFQGHRGGSNAQGLSDLEALRLRKDVRILPLQRQAKALLKDLPSLGSADYTTGNSCVTCTRREQVKDILTSKEGSAIFGDLPGLRWLDDSWRHSVAVLKQGQDFTDAPPCLLLYGETGELAHQVTLWDPAAWEGFIDIVCRHKGCWNCLRTLPDPQKHSQIETCPAWLLRDAWCEAESELDLDLRLRPLGLKRVTALRAMEGLFTTSIEPHRLASIFQEVAVLGIPVHVEVRNRHCTQVLESAIETFQMEESIWEVKMAQTTLTIKPTNLDSTWLVAQPQTRAERPRFECYNVEGEPVLTLSGPEDPCPGVAEAWQGLIGRLEAQ